MPRLHWFRISSTVELLKNSFGLVEIHKHIITFLSASKSKNQFSQKGKRNQELRDIDQNFYRNNVTKQAKLYAVNPH